MLEVAICDDNILFSGQLEEKILQLSKLYFIKMDVEVYSDGSNLLLEIANGKHFNIIFMDIEMKQMDGIKTATQIREVDQAVQFIFVTSYEKYMRNTFCVAPIGFVTKPVQYSELKKVFYLAIMVLNKKKEYYYFEFNKIFYKIKMDDIMYFQSKARFVLVACTNEIFKQYEKLSKIEAECEQKGQFLRIHQSYLVNFKYIDRISSDNIRLQKGIILPVSKSKKQEIDKKMQIFMGWHV